MTTARNRRRAFTLRDLLVVIGLIAILLALSVPWIQSSREVARGHQCMNNLKEIGLSLLNYESTRKCLPPISSNVDAVPDIPGDAAPSQQGAELGTSSSSAAGYSWQSWILCDVNQVAAYQNAVTSSRKFTLPAWSPEVTSGLQGAAAPHPATVQVSEFRCPSSASQLIDASPRTVGVKGGSIETGTVPPNYKSKIATANGAQGIGLTNYNAILGTHIDPITKSASDPNNGGMKFRGSSFYSGTRLGELTDGTSKVPLVCETREQRFSSWYDGTMNWVVAARHGDLTPAANPLANPVSLTTAAEQVTVRGVPLPANRLIIGTDGTSKTGGSALNYGPTPTTPTAVYLPSGSLTDPDISSAPPGRLWGPSSLHRGGIVNHVFADGHVQGISDAIEPNMYLWIVTLAGGEPTDAGP